MNFILKFLVLAVELVLNFHVLLLEPLCEVANELIRFLFEFLVYDVIDRVFLDMLSTIEFRPLLLNNLQLLFQLLDLFLSLFEHFLEVQSPFDLHLKLFLMLLFGQLFDLLFITK